MKKEYFKIFFIIIFLFVICISDCVYAIPGVVQEQKGYQYEPPIKPGDLTGGRRKYG